MQSWSSCASSLVFFFDIAFIAVLLAVILLSVARPNIGYGSTAWDCNKCRLVHYTGWSLGYLCNCNSYYLPKCLRFPLTI